MENSWKLDEYTISQLQQAINDKRIIIPAYQRGIVWKNDQQKALIDTIKKGFPFGSLLVYEEASGKLQLIDGLQRSSTIFKYVEDPSSFFDEQDVDDQAIYSIISLMELGNMDAVKQELLERIKEIIIKWVRNSAVKKLQSSQLANTLLEEFPALQDWKKQNQVAELLLPMIEQYQSVYDFIMSVKIPVIKLTGKSENLPDIFERINSTGATLTKYQIYSATWSHSTIRIQDERLFSIVDHVCNRYDELSDGLLEIEDYDSTKTKQKKELNIFDLCFGFGKLLCNTYPYLFGKSSAKTKVDSVGFTLINACLGYRVNEMSKLHTNLKSIGSDHMINDFLCKILDCVDEIDRYLKVVTSFKGNKRNDSNISINHTEMQIISIIAFVFIQKYVSLEKDENTENVIARSLYLDHISDSWNQMKKQFRRNFIKIYVLDCIQEKWRGSGDKKLNNIIQNDTYYYRDINWSDFEAAIDAWFDNILYERKEEKKVANPKEPEKVLLNIVHAQTMPSVSQLDDTRYDIEHIVPKAAIKELLGKVNKGKKESDRLKLPISSIGNLCYLPDIENRAKKQKTIYQDNQYLKGKSLDEIEQRYTFTERNDLEWIENPNITADDIKNAYVSFVRKRWNSIKIHLKAFLDK